MSIQQYRNSHLHIENVALRDIAQDLGTPCYVYSRKAIEDSYLAYRNALDSDGENKHLVCYAVKANSNLAVLNILAKLGSGFDIVSLGELERVIAAGGSAEKIVFSGVAKSSADIRHALEVGIHCFNVESETELARIAEVAKSMQVKAPISLRVNPDVDAKTHPYIATGLAENKFGVDIEEAPRIYIKASNDPHLNVIGVDCHIGSQLTELAPFEDALQRVLTLVDSLASHNITLKHIDIGGGLGVTYQDELPPSIESYIKMLLSKLGPRQINLVMEPGRSIVANAGFLISKVDTIKSNPVKNFAIVDVAMNDMLRPALYNAWMQALPLSLESKEPLTTYDIVGPVCETGDFLAKERILAIAEGDYICLNSAGAYGFVMSSNYNSRPRAAEVMVDKSNYHIVRERESMADLIRGERLLP